MDEVTWFYGRMKFEDGTRPIILHKHRNDAHHAYFIDGPYIRRRLILAKEMKYFTEWSDEPRVVKRIIRRFLGKNTLSGRRFEIAKTLRKALKEAL